jgi:aryl-alcohol dehydrogenase-like predicted oxidoreductase
MNNLRTLGARELRVSTIGFGCMGMSHAYGQPADRGEMISLLHKAVEMGYTYFDTAEIYGTPDDPHHNEVLVGEALKQYRNQVVISTKFGLTPETLQTGGAPHPLVTDSRPETIRFSVEGSLRRLQTDHIDLYYQHRVDANVSPEEVAGVMADLISEGKILNWGVSEAPEEYIRRAHKVCPISAIQNRLSMMARWHEGLFPLLDELNIGFVAFSPLANGLLSDAYTKDSTFDASADYRSAMPQYRAESFEKNRALMQLLHSLAEEHNATPAQISLAWLICKKPYIVPIPGSRKLNRIKENLGAAGIHLTTDEVSRIDNMLDQVGMSDVFGGAPIKK